LFLPPLQSGQQMRLYPFDYGLRFTRNLVIFVMTVRVTGVPVRRVIARHESADASPARVRTGQRPTAG